MVRLLRDAFTASERRARRVLGFSRTTQRRNSPKRKKDQRLVEHLHTLVQERPRFEYRRIHLMLGRESEAVNHIRGAPQAITTDNGPEFAGKALDLWTHDRGIAHTFIRPGKPVENA